MHFSDKSAEDVLSSSFSNSPIYRVTDRWNEKIMFANKWWNTSSREREEKWLSGELIPQHI
jgi:hypothetical protein